MSKRPAFIWDLDGTLLDSYKIIVPSMHRALLGFGIDMKEEDIHQVLITYSLGVFLSQVEGKYGIPSDVLREKFSEINDAEALNTEAIPNAAEILAYLKGEGIRSYVYTHKGVTTLPVLKKLGLYAFFDDIITSENGFPKKPDPAAIVHLIQKHGLDKEKCFYVGDRTLDVACACNAGIKSILYLPENSLAKADGRQTYIVKDLLEIKDIVKPFIR